MKTSDAIRHYGSVTNLAKVLNIKGQAISQWGEFVPKGRAYEIQALTNGKLTVDQSAYPDRIRKADICER